MITIIKETPITIDGVDYLEQLVKDSECFGFYCCGKCCYRDWTRDEELDVDCCDVHGCGLLSHRYFLIRQL